MLHALNRRRPVDRTVVVLAVALAGALGLGGCRARQPQESLVVGGDPRHGPALVRQYGCGTCHAVQGVTGANGRVGPPLTGFGERVYIAGTIPNKPEALVAWIQDPQSLQPLTAMPNVGVTNADARHIAAYLYTLR